MLKRSADSLAMTCPLVALLHQCDTGAAQGAGPIIHALAAD
jgi:hypothetical protein